MNFFAGLFLLFMPEENAFWYVWIIHTLYIEKDSVAFIVQDWFLNCNLLLNSRALVGVIDDYFDGYYTEEMIESQVLFNLLILMHALFPSYI